MILNIGIDLLNFRDVYRQFKFVQDRIGGESDDILWIVGTNVEYAAYVEFGTSKMEAQPYLLPAAREVAQQPERHIRGDVKTPESFAREVALAIERRAKEKVPVDTGRLKNSIEAQRVQ